MNPTVRNLLTGPAQVGTGFLVLFTLTGFPQVDTAAKDHTPMPVGRQGAFATTLVPRVELEGDWVVYERRSLIATEAEQRRSASPGWKSRRLPGLRPAAP